jgi:hypothetical protein
MLLVILGLAVILWFGYISIPVKSLGQTVQEHGAVVASIAKIKRKFPQSNTYRGGWDTLVLVRPAIISSVDQVHGPCFLVIANEAWVPGEIEVAIKTKAELNLTTNLHAMLPSSVKVFSVDAHNRAKQVDTHRVNFVCIQDTENPPPVTTTRSGG